MEYCRFGKFEVYLKKYWLSFYAKHFLLFLLIMLNWSIEGNLTLYYLTA